MSEKVRTYILDIDDPLRLDLNSYWIEDQFAAQTLGQPILMNSQYSVATLDPAADTFYQKRQTINVTKQAAFDSVQDLLIAEDDSGQTFAVGSTTFEDYVKSRFIPYFDSHNSLLTANKDTVFSAHSPIVTKDFSTTSDPAMGINEVKEEFLINFLEKRFEDAIAPPAISELSLPNFYDVIKVGGNPPQDSYFDDYANDVPPPDSKYENIMISMDNYEEMERINGFDKVFPLEVKISPYNAAISRMTGFHDALDDSNLDLTLIDLMSRRLDVQHVGASVKNSYSYRMVEWEILPNPNARKIGEAEVKLESLDMLAWSRGISDVIDSLTTISPASNKIYLGPDNQSINIAKGNAGTLREILSSAMFLGKIKELIRDNLRSFSDINKGEKSYSEIVFYKVEKYTSPDAPTPIQNIWIPNIDQIDPIEYVDTQVKYNKSYTYKIHAYSAVIGTKYYYDTSTFGATFPMPDGRREPCAIRTDRGATVPDHVHTIENWKIKNNPEDATGDDKINNHIHPDLIPVAGDYGWTAGHTKAVEGFDTFGVDILFDGGEDGNHLHKYRVDSDGNGTTLCHEEILEIDIVPDTPGMEFFQIDVITEPTVELIRTELFNFSGFILDDPPMIPDVKFTSYIGIDNKITVNMQAQIGEYKNKPVILNSEDSDFIDSLRLARGLPAESLITYKTDDETSAFEVYRMETMPTSYDDFSNNLRTTISTLQRDSFSTIYSWDMSHMDSVIPNKEYYYMIRSVDIHNHKSYPSPVYKIQMVNDSGAIYPLVEVIEMKPQEKPRMKMRKFKKFLQLIPSFAQTSIDYAGSNLIASTGLITNSALGKEADITLGSVTPKLFGNSSYGQTFKIRLISKHTGKKLDLNVTFKVENEL
jgi:hypothetical protein